MITMSLMLPEWHPQAAVMLAWPHANTDWSPWLADIEPTYIALAQAISQEATPLILCQDAQHQRHIQNLLAGTCKHQPMLVVQPYNDTWCRDYGVISVANDAGLKLLDFCFNGWGDKYDATLDNQVNQKLNRYWTAPLASINLELEGGSIETDGQGTLLTTSQCLLNTNRGEQRSQQAIEKQLQETLGVDRFLWLHNGTLIGDDTDSHIDNLARFTDPETLVYLTCSDPADPHFEPLQAMAREIQQFRQRNGTPYRTFAIEMPGPIMDSELGRLPASYVNFLILNNSVIVPVFEQAEDEQALAQLQQAFPNKALLTVPGQHLIKQFGGPHCATMQLPVGTIKTHTQKSAP